ncbi:hypothetical protein ACLKA6_010062 [Drosophila palustris]
MKKSALRSTHSRSLRKRLAKMMRTNRNKKRASAKARSKSKKVAYRVGATRYPLATRAGKKRGTTTMTTMIAHHLATQKPVAIPVRAAQKIAIVAGQQEAQDERPSTSAAAAARLSTSSAPTEPRASYASVAKKVKVAVLPVDYPQGQRRLARWKRPTVAQEKAVVESPPPAEMDLSPAAVSESRARQADPTDPLEDLAEDEDLADLALDPAMAVEIEEQMAMSSQEISDELEAAGVTLTVRNDGEDSRPPSSCSMEPLL